MSDKPTKTSRFLFGDSQIQTRFKVRSFPSAYSFKYQFRDDDGKVNGYAFARDIAQNDLSQGLSLQPFYADNAEIAEKLLLRVIQLSGGVKIQASAPVLNSNFFNLIDQYFQPDYFKDGNTNLTMGNEYSLDLEKIYGMLDYTTSIC